MSRRTKLFAMIPIGLFGRKSFKALAGIDLQLAYLAMRLSPESSYEGLFIYSIEEMARDLSVSEDQATALFDGLCAAGLIDRDPTSGFVRIRGVARDVDRPANASTFRHRFRTTLTTSCPELLLVVAVQAELVIAALELLIGWDEDKKEREKLSELLLEMVPEFEADGGESFVEALKVEAKTASPTVRRQLETFCPSYEKAIRHGVGTEKKSGAEGEHQPESNQQAEKSGSEAVWQEDEIENETRSTTAKVNGEEGPGRAGAEKRNGSCGAGADKSGSPLAVTRDSLLARQARLVGVKANR